MIAIALTASAGVESLRQTRLAGFHHCLFKPVALEQLISVIVQLLPLKQSLKTAMVIDFNTEIIQLQSTPSTPHESTGTVIMNAIDLIKRYLNGERNFQQANLQGIDLKQADLQEIDCCSANLSDAKLFAANLAHANLSKTNLHRASLYKADLTQANLQQSDLQAADLREVKLQGASLVQADLRGANLMNADLREANLQSTILCGTDLFGARFHRANLRKADLRGADLFGVHLETALYDQYTQFDPGFDPICQEMQRLE